MGVEGDAQRHQSGADQQGQRIFPAVVGGALSIAGNALVAHFVFKMTPVAPPLLSLGAVATAATVTVVTGLLTSRGVTDHPPLEILRQET